MTQAASLKQKISDDVRRAMKSGDTIRRSILRLLLSEIANAEIAKRSPLEEGDILAVIAKEVKRHQESIEAFKLGKRADLVSQEEAELAILHEYQPRQLTRAEIEETARRIIREVAAAGPRDKGKVMPRIMAELKGKADGREINEVVTGLLAA